MRVNVYAEELTDRVELIEKEIEGHKYVALRFYTELPVTTKHANGGMQQTAGPFIHRPGDDDSAAVTFWGKRSMRKMLQKALDILDAYYGDKPIEYEWLSPTAMSNLYTMGCTSAVDPRQAIPAPYTIPPEETRRLRARLILEEALETVEALGFAVAIKDEDGDGDEITMESVVFEPSHVPDLEKIIDGCCDTQYVTIGTLCACGVCDEPHVALVNRANNDKFPDGDATANEHGKFQKPEGWQAPDHLRTAVRATDLRPIVEKLLTHAKTHNAADDEDDSRKQEPNEIYRNVDTSALAVNSETPGKNIAD